MADSVYKKVTDEHGNVSFVEVQQGLLATPAADWVKARSSETSTKLGVVGGIVAGPTLADYASKAVLYGLAGDYVSCALYGVPALLGFVGSLSAIITPEKQPGHSDDEIHAAVARMPRDQLISLLQQPVELSTAANTNN